MDERKERMPAMSYGEVAELLGITRQAVCYHEQIALRKLRNHPVIRELAKELSLIKGFENE